MSGRLTNKWTERSGGAFGKAGDIGDIGEEEVVAYLRDTFPDSDIVHHPSDQAIQTSGIDITIDGYGIDVKTNLHTGKDVIVEKPKLMRTKSMFWLHWNIEDKNDGPVIYAVEKMKRQIAHTSGWGKDELVFVKRKDIP